MKRFVIKLLLFGLVFLLITISVDITKTKSKRYAATVNGSEIYCAINKSCTNKKVKKLLLGDSVGHQLYPCENDYDSIVSLACNQAVTMAGHFFLLENYIESNADNLPEEVILFLTPFTLRNDVDFYAYHYFLKPFPPYNWSEQYTSHLKQRVHSIPLYWSANLPFIQTSNYTPKWATPSLETIESISQLSYEYLLKMDSLTKQHDISFRMVSPPLRDDKEKTIDSIWQNMPPTYATQLNTLLQPYKEGLVFLPSCLYVDHAHFQTDKIPVDYLGVLN